MRSSQEEHTIATVKAAFNAFLAIARSEFDIPSLNSVGDMDVALLISDGLELLQPDDGLIEQLKTDLVFLFNDIGTL